LSIVAFALGFVAFGVSLTGSYWFALQEPGGWLRALRWFHPPAPLLWAYCVAAKPLAGTLALWVFRATSRRWAAWDTSDKGVSVTGCVAAAAGVLIAAVDVAVGIVFLLAALILHFVTI